MTRIQRLVPMSAALLLTLAGCGEEPQTGATTSPFRATADVFSGRPNPEWDASDEARRAAATCLDQLAQADEAAAAPPSPGGLGFGGVTFEPAPASGGTALTRIVDHTAFGTRDGRPVTAECTALGEATWEQFAELEPVAVKDLRSNANAS